VSAISPHRAPNRGDSDILNSSIESKAKDIMAWKIDVTDGCAVVQMNSNKVNVQNDQFFTDLHAAFDRLEKEFPELPVVLTGQGDVFSAGIDFKYSFDIFGSGSLDKIRDWYQNYRATNLRIFQYPRPTVAAINGHAMAGGLITSEWRPANPCGLGLTKYPSVFPCLLRMWKLSSTLWATRSRP
jgi:enoyl-CoA hydratase